MGRIDKRLISDHQVFNCDRKIFYQMAVDDRDWVMPPIHISKKEKKSNLTQYKLITELGHIYEEKIYKKITEIFNHKKEIDEDKDFKNYILSKDRLLGIFNEFKSLRIGEQVYIIESSFPTPDGFFRYVLDLDEEDRIPITHRPVDTNKHFAYQNPDLLIFEKIAIYNAPPPSVNIISSSTSINKL